MKKIFIMFMILLVIISLSGCGKTLKTEDGSISIKDGKLEIETDEGTTTFSEGKMTVENDEGNTVFESSEEGLDLPDGYPEDLVPIIKDSTIVVATREEVSEGTQHWLMVGCKKEVKEVVEFYKDIMDGAENKQVMESSDMNILSGMKDGKQITISVFPEGTEYKTSYNIIIVTEE